MTKNERNTPTEKNMNLTKELEKVRNRK